ncbi:MAG: alpha/beta hydrolase [Flavobacteriales bacterium]
MLPFKLQLVLFYLHRVQKTDLTKLKPSSIRRGNAKAWKREKRIAEHPSPSVHSVENIEIPVRDGSQIPVRIYRPSEKKNLKTIVYYHGGGFVLRNIETHDDLCRRIAIKTNSLVISVGYRLAPEFKFPIPVYDCYDALIWAEKNCANWGGNSNDLVVMGDSAGGNLATVVSLLARDEAGPAISKQVLIYPCLDARLAYPSIDKFRDGYLLTKSMMEWFVNHYAKTQEDTLNPLMSPLLADDFSNLPKAFVCTADHDPLKDEGKEYYQRLSKAENNGVFKEYKNTIHAFANMPRLTKQANVLVDDIAAFLAE